MLNTLLIIEDDPAILGLLGDFSTQLGYQAVLKPEIVSIRELQDIQPGLILLDHRVAHQLGGDFIYHLKHTPQTREIPVILMSAAVDVVDIALANGADGSVSKPFNLKEIQEIFEKYLG